jgi:hypothetical protein
MSTGATIRRIAAADHRSIAAEVRQRNSHKPSQQGNFTQIGQGIQKGRYGLSICFDEMAKPPHSKQFRAIVDEDMTLNARDISSQK